MYSLESQHNALRWEGQAYENRFLHALGKLASEWADAH